MKKENKKTPNTKKEKSNKPKMSVVKTFFKLLPRIYKASPKMFIASNILGVMHGISWAVITLATQLFFDSAADYTKGLVQISAVIWFLVFLTASHILSQALNGIANRVPQICAEKTMNKLSVDIHKKIATLSPESFENTDLLDDINKADAGKNTAVWFVLKFLLLFVFYLPYLGFMSFYLFNVSPVLALCIVLVFIPTALTQILRAKVFAKTEDKAAPIRREAGYYDQCMMSRDYYKETRILGAVGFFQKLFLSALKKTNKLSFRASAKSNLAELFMKLLTLAGYAGILYLLFTTLMDGKISVGAFAAIFTSMGLVFNMMEELICVHIANISRDMATVRNYINFMELPERGGKDITITPSAQIIAKNLSFAYPKAEHKAVDDVSFTINSKETIAIVGENGSGKSTLIRLLMGLYLPTEGDVLHGDINTKTASMQSLYQNTSAVFQKYRRYQMTLKDNIILSDTKNSDIQNSLVDACDKAGVEQNGSSYPNSFDTMLSREFDGVDLSGGQWQRVAIARGFYRTHNFIVLDEPTAAIDPFEETKIYNRFATIAKDKTAIIVTHRIGSVRLADRILVMDKGKLVESGTHDQLINNNGEYARLYKSQEQWYK